MAVLTKSMSFALAATLLLAGCGALPLRPERPHTAAQPPAADSTLVRIARDSAPAPELSGFRLMPLGIFSLDARIELTHRARHSLDVQYYHIHDDNTGRLLLRSLRDAAMRGVRVRLLVDDLYTSGADPLFRGFAAFPNVEVRLFNPFCCGRTSLLAKYTASLLDFRRVNRRMHNKLFIADGAMVVAGGRNIADEYFMRSTTGNFVDMDAMIVGAVVPQLARIFDNYWNAPEVYPVETIVTTGLTAEQLRHDFNSRVDDGEQMMKLKLPPVDVLGYGAISEDLDAGRLGLIWGKAIAFADPPGKASAATDEEARAMSVTMGVMDRIMAAHREVVLTSPYLIPGKMGVQRSTTSASAMSR